MFYPPSPDLTCKPDSSLASMLVACRVEMVAAIDVTHADERSDMIRAAVIDHGGTLLEPGTSTWGPAEATLTLLGITGIGPTLEAAIASWTKATRRSYGSELLAVTPR